MNSVNIIPLYKWVYIADYIDIVIENILLQNIAMFIPFGILLPLLFKKLDSFKWVLAIVFFFSLGIELLLYSTSLFLFDIDDIIFNSLGAVIGFILLLV
ncbi:VanZ family protein [Risungbinella massiliensis]|uniref:VanZ family protein n=1 Tax=Risungbinella massiliensis TaxID=1329796 RepID=UPI00069B1E82